MSAPVATQAAHGGFALVDPDSGRTLKVLPFRYDPDTLAHQIAPRMIRGEAPSPAGPSAETITLEAEFEPVDRQDWPNGVPLPARYGLHPVLAALETTMHPTSDHLLLQRDKTRGGVLEIAPAESPLVVLVLGQSRVQPVQIVDYRVEECESDAALNQGRAKVSLTLRVLTNDDLGFDHDGGRVYRDHQRIRRTN